MWEPRQTPKGRNDKLTKSNPTVLRPSTSVSCLPTPDSCLFPNNFSHLSYNIRTTIKTNHRIQIAKALSAAITGKNFARLKVTGP